MRTLTHTYSILPISKQAYDEIKKKLEEAGYQEQFHGDRIDMNGLAIAVDSPRTRICESQEL